MINAPYIFDLPLFALGFRVFFALAGISALLLIVLWNAIFQGSITADNYFPHSFWHAHEMLLGYSVAVISGFLLTAVKNWTGKSTLSGRELAGLSLLWLYGRVVPFYEGLLPDVFIASVDFCFLPVLAYQISKPILQTRHYKSLFFIGIITLLTLGNGLIHLEILKLAQNTASMGIQLVLATIIILILIMAGRVFPFFTERGLGTIIIRNPLLDNLSIASSVLVFGLLLLSISGTTLALAAVLAALANTARVAGWYVQKIWYAPLLWVLYTGYGWIILGFILTMFSAYSLVSASLSLHAFTIGGIGVLTLGMMARVSLGHTGRALRASNAIAIAFVMINLTVILRVLLPMAIPAWYNSLIYLSMLSWLLAFALFIFVYAPILTSPRIDGQPG